MKNHTKMILSAIALLLMTQSAMAEVFIPQRTAASRAMGWQGNSRVRQNNGGHYQNTNRSFKTRSTSIADEARNRHAQMQSLRVSTTSNQTQQEILRRQQDQRRQRDLLQKQEETNRLAKIRAEQQAARAAQNRFRAENRAAQLQYRQQYRQAYLTQGNINTSSERSVLE